MYYDSVYKNNPKISKKKPNRLLPEIAKKLSLGMNVLDLGCGQGRDAFYMARQKFDVTAVDSSKAAVSQIKDVLREKKIDNIRVICQDIAKFKIEPGKYSFINCCNSLQFLPKRNALKVIENIQKNILPGGFIAIVSFVANTQLLDKNKSRFGLGEMKKMFSSGNFKILHYFEGDRLEKGHIGRTEPHSHRIVEIVAEKIGK